MLEHSFILEASLFSLVYLQLGFLSPLPFSLAWIRCWRPLQTSSVPIFTVEYDELSSTAKLELKEKQLASKVAYYDTVAADVLSKPSHQSNPHPISNDIPSVNVHLVAYDETRTRESLKGNPALFDDPSYATPFP